MTITNSVKRFAAAALAVIMVAGAAPAALGGVKLFDTAIVASAAEKSESITTTGNNSFTGDHFSIIGNGNYHDSLGIYLGGYGGPTITISALNGETISKIEAVIGHAQNVGSDTVEADNGTVSGDLTQGSTITVSDIDSSSVTLSFTSSRRWISRTIRRKSLSETRTTRRNTSAPTRIGTRRKPLSSRPPRRKD